MKLDLRSWQRLQPRLRHLVCGVSLACALRWSAACAGTSVTFVVQAPADTPANATLYIAGNVLALGPWDPGRLALGHTVAGAYTTTLSLPESLLFEYKITRGSWETVEKGPQGEEIANRQYRVLQPDTVTISPAAWRDHAVGARPQRAQTITGDVRLLHHVHSAFLENDRDVWVYLPPSYGSSPNRRYPALYFHDGQNVFDAATSFIGVEWGADETLQRLAAAGDIPEVIAVAVANTPRRMQEYTQAPDPPRPAAPLAPQYVRFLVEELKPRIDREFRTQPGRESTGLIGSSLGGLVSLYAGVQAPSTFGLVAGLSPVLPWGGHDLEQRYRAAERTNLPLRIWIDMGTAERASDSGRDSELIRELRRFRDVLIERGFVLGTDLESVEAAGAHHDERAWAERLPEILKFLLAAPR